MLWVSHTEENHVFKNWTAFMVAAIFKMITLTIKTILLITSKVIMVIATINMIERNI